MKTPLRLIPSVAALCLCAALASEWTVKLPEPKLDFIGQVERRSSPHGFLLGGLVADTARIIWLSPVGETLLDAQVTGIRVAIPDAYILNSRQLLVWAQTGQTQDSMLYRLYTVKQPGEWEAKDYRLESNWTASTVIGPTGGLLMKSWQSISPDTSALYVLDVGGWTLRRIDFPEPPAIEPASVGVEIEGADQPEGPWQAIQSVTVPADKPQEFFRLKASKEGEWGLQPDKQP